MTVTDFVPDVIFNSPERETAFQVRLKRAVDNGNAVGVIKGLLMTNRVLKHRIRVLEDKQPDSPPQIITRRDPILEQARERLTGEVMTLRRQLREYRNRAAVRKFRKCESCYVIQPRLLRVRAVG